VILKGVLLERLDSEQDLKMYKNKREQPGSDK
jgi:hypothetical protein